MSAPAAVPAARLSLDVLVDVRELVAYPFMVHALEAGTIVAVTAGVVGWFMVLRRQAFAGHTLAVVGFPGAAGAAYLGLPLGVGYFGACVAAALAIAPARQRARWRGDEPALIGTLQAFALAAGVVFVGLYHGFLGGVTALLFGSFLGVTSAEVLALGAVGAASLALLAAIGRPLWFASLDEAVAAARGVSVRLLGAAYLVVLGATVAEVSQVTGSLLVFALLVMPAAAAQRLSARPAVGLALSVGIGLAVTWLGLAAAFFSAYPAGFFLTSFGFGAYVAALAAAHARSRRAGAEARA